MTFPSVVKKTGPIKIFKTGTGSKTLSPGSPRSPGSPINTSVKTIEIGSSVKSPLANKAPGKISNGTSIKKVQVNPKTTALPISPTTTTVIKPVTDVKSELAKPASSPKKVIKSVIKPPPLKLNIKVPIDNGLQSPITPKFTIKTPSTPVKKSLTMNKSPTVETVKSPCSPSIKLSKVSSPVIKSQVYTGAKSSTSSSLSVNKSASKSSVVSLPITKSLKTSNSFEASTVPSPIIKSPSASAVPKTSMVATISKSSLASSKPSIVKSLPKIVVKDNAKTLTSTQLKPVVVKPLKPVQKTSVLSTKSITGVNIPFIPTSKSSTISRSSSMASDIKSISLKVPNSPSKLITKESTAVKISNKSTAVPGKSNIISKSLPASNVLLKKGPSTLSSMSVKSSSSIKSTSSVIKPTMSKTKITSTISKHLELKLPITKTQPLVVAKIPSLPTVKTPSSPIVKILSSPVVKILSSPVLKTPSSPVVKTPSSVVKTSSPVVKTSSPVVKTSSPVVKTPSPVLKTASSTVVKTPLSSMVKTPLSPVVKMKAPLSPTVKPRTPSISTAKPPMSPARQKLLPTKLLLSPTKSKLLSSRLRLVSTESSASRTSLKSPMSSKPIKVVSKSPSKDIKKKNEIPIVEGVQDGQINNKIINITEIAELPSNSICNEPETSDVKCEAENTIKDVLEDMIESTITQVTNVDPSEMMISIDNLCKANKFVDEHTLLNVTNDENVRKSLDVEHNLEIIGESLTTASPSITTSQESKQDEDSSSLLDFEFLTIDECVPHLNSVSQSVDNSGIVFNDDHFSTTVKNVEQPDEMQSSCIIEMEDSFESMNDKLVLGDMPFETDSNQSDNSDIEQIAHKEIIQTMYHEDVSEKRMDYVFSFSDTDDLTNNNIFNRADSTENFINQFMPKSVEQSESVSSSISTDDGSFLSRKSYSEAVLGSPNNNKFYFECDVDLVDDCLDYDDDASVFVEVTEKEFPELKPKSLSGKRKNKKQKKRNYTSSTDSQSDSSLEEINYNPKDFYGNEFCYYIKMMKDCLFYPNGLFASDSVKLSTTSSTLSWLDISVRTTDGDLVPSTESLNTYEVFQASNLNKEFIMSFIGCNSATTPSSNETSWFWKSIEGRHQSLSKTNITLSLQPRPKHLTTPRFMVLLALISEAKGYEIQPSLSEHFVTTDCMPRFDNKIRRLMVQGFWLVGCLIKESLLEDKEINCGNPFGFADGDMGYWWAGINMLDWQDYLKGCDQKQTLLNCYQFVIKNNIDGKRQNSSKALLNMNAAKPEELMTDLDCENFIHTVRNVKYDCSNYFVDSEDSEEHFEATISDEGDNDDTSLSKWEYFCE